MAKTGKIEKMEKLEIVLIAGFYILSIVSMMRLSQRIKEVKNNQEALLTKLNNQ